MQRNVKFKGVRARGKWSGTAIFFRQSPNFWDRNSSQM